MKKILILSTLFFCTLSHADLFKFDEDIYIDRDSVSILKSPKRVNFNVKSPTTDYGEGSYMNVNFTVICSNQTQRLNSVNLYNSSDNFIRSLSVPVDKTTPKDIIKGSFPDLIYRAHCLK